MWQVAGTSIAMAYALVMPADSHVETEVISLVPRRGVGPALLWAFYLGSSWTWVIGMMLPVMLVRDYGWMGFAAFAVPNVVGAAAMGFFVRSRKASQLFVAKHARACQWFTGITVAFQLYVAAWWLPEGLGFASVLLLVIAVAAGSVLGLRKGSWALLALAAGVGVLSLGAFSFAVRLPDAFTGLSGPTRLQAIDLWALGAATCFGFALCPYLDLTFHRARQSTDIPTGRAAFAVGFGGVFACMILFTLGYSAVVWPTLQAGAAGGEAAIPGVWRALLGIHLSVQIAFTLLVHFRESQDNPKASVGRLAGLAGAGLVAGLGVRLIPGDTVQTVLAGVGWSHGGGFVPGR